MSFGFEQAENKGNHRIYGVVPGIVVDNKDPQGAGRVKVSFPCLSGDEAGYWARLASVMAGDGRGMVCIPEEGDEVLAAFEDGDINKAFIIGVLWNGRDSIPYANEDRNNNLRIIKSRSGHIIRFDDTKNNEKFEIIDKSGNNIITIDSANNLILVKSENDININAPQGTIRLNAQNIEITASESVNADARSGMELRSSGNTVLRGNTVNIN